MTWMGGGSFHAKNAQRMKFIERMEFGVAGKPDEWVFDRLRWLRVWLLRRIAQIMQYRITRREARDQHRASRDIGAMSDHMRRDIGLSSWVTWSQLEAFDRFD